MTKKTKLPADELMSEQDAQQDFVQDPLIELLAIKLYEHAKSSTVFGYGPNVTKWPPEDGWRPLAWGCIGPKFREKFRDMARGKEPIG